jgi:hypothetical protein
MRSLWNSLGDPGLHLLAIALIVIYLAFSRGSSSAEERAVSPLPYCESCRLHFMPGGPCGCTGLGGMVHAMK